MLKGMLSEKEAVSILKQTDAGFLLADVDVLKIGEPALLLLANGEIAKTSRVQQLTTYPDTRVWTKNSCYYVAR